MAEENVGCARPTGSVVGETKPVKEKKIQPVRGENEYRCGLNGMKIRWRRFESEEV